MPRSFTQIRCKAALMARMCDLAEHGVVAERALRRQEPSGLRHQSP